MGKVFITGPGRSGTTFLMQLLTRLGCDTGQVPYKENFIPQWRSGCEIKLDMDTLAQAIDVFQNTPRYIKGPVWAYYLKFLLNKEILEIDHIVMPMRDLTDSALSRLEVGLDFMVDAEYVGMPDKHLSERQENVLAMLVGKVLEVYYFYDVPLTMMKFPELVQDEGYCFEKVKEFEDVDREQFGEKWRELAWQ